MIPVQGGVDVASPFEIASAETFFFFGVLCLLLAGGILFASGFQQVFPAGNNRSALVLAACAVTMAWYQIQDWPVVVLLYKLLGLAALVVLPLGTIIALARAMLGEA